MPGPGKKRPKKKGTKKKLAAAPPVELLPPAVISSPPLPIAEEQEEIQLPREPPIYDPGNGPRVKNINAFFASSFCCPPSFDDELCAEFAQEEMLDMLYTVLPHELALCVWYNKSRLVSRICPACRRLYRPGDVSSGPLEGIRDLPDRDHPQVLSEQVISGLCSPVCFIVASINYPEAIRLIYGKMADEMEEVTWEFLNTKGDGREDEGLSMVLRMTRLHDLGLAQLCLPDVEFPEDDEYGL